MGKQQQQYFIKNKGQVTTTKGKEAKNVAFKYEAGSVDLYFQQDRVSYVYPKREYKPTPDDPRQDSALQTTALYRMDMVLKGANSEAELKGEAKRASHSNYFTGQAEAAKVPHYGKLVYEDIYEGIDLVYKFKKGKLKYEFVVHEGADPEQIRMKYKGAESLKKSKEGGLALTNPFGKLNEAEPIAFYGKDKDRKISCEFKLLSEDKIGFDMGEIPDGKFIIDPYLSYSSYLGGSGEDQGYDLEVNQADKDEIQVVGQTNSTSFPNTTGIIPYQQSGDGFIAEFASDRSLNWFTYYGNDNFDAVTGIDVVKDGSGNQVIYITGHTEKGSNNNYNLHGTKQATFGTPSGRSLFIGELDGTGNAVAYSIIGSSMRETGGGVLVNGNSVYITGTTRGTSFPADVCFKSFQGGVTDGIIASFSQNLSAKNYSSYYGGSDEDRVYELDALGTDDIVIKGITESDDVIGNLGYQNQYQDQNNSFDHFLARWDDGCFIESTYLGGKTIDGNTQNQFSNSLAIDDQGNIHVTGMTTSDDFPVTPDAYQSSYAGNTDIFYTRFDNDLATLDYSTYLGSSNAEKGKGIIAFSRKHYIIGGYANSKAMPTTGTAFYNYTAGKDNYLMEFRRDSLAWSTYYGGDNTDQIFNVAKGGKEEKFFVTGITESSNYPLTNNSDPDIPHQTTFGGIIDAFLTGFSVNQNCKTSQHTLKNNWQVGTDKSPISGSYRIKNKLTIPKNEKVQINHADLVFDKCAKLVVEAGADVEIRNSNLRTCSDGLWQGVIVKKGTKLVNVENTNIEDAQVGVHADRPDALEITRSAFQNNIHHVILENLFFNDDFPSSYEIRDNQFNDIRCKTTLNCSRPSTMNIPSWAQKCNMVNIGAALSFSRFSGGAVIANNEFQGTTKKNNLSRGIRLHRVDARSPEVIEKNVFGPGISKNAIDIDWSKNLLLNDQRYFLSNNQTGIKILNSQSVTMDSNFMEQAAGSSQKYDYGIYVKNEKSTHLQTKNIPISRNEIAGAQHGMYLKNVRDASVQPGNILENFDHGIEYYADQNHTNASVIRKNKITGGTSGNPSGDGIVVAPKKDPVGAGSGANDCGNPNNGCPTINLEIRCNKIWYNELGIVGSGYLIDQISSTQPAGNMFNDPNNPQTSPSRNSEWDILWRNRFTSTDWTYHYSSQTIKPNDANNSTPNLGPKTINGKTIGNGSNATLSQINRNGIGYLGCYGTWKRNPFSTSKQEVQDQPVRVYPNPVQDEVTIQTPDVKEGQVQVLNMTGQTVLTDQIQGGSQTLNTENWETGTYIIRITSRQGDIYTKKLLKVSQ